MNYKRFLFNTNFHILVIILLSGFLINNNVFFLLAGFFFFVNVKDYSFKIISFNLNTIIYSITTTFTVLIEIIYFESNYSALIFLLIFIKHNNSNFSYLKYYINRLNIKHESIDFIANTKNDYYIYLKNYTLIVKPTFSGIIFNDVYYKLEYLISYLIEHDKDFENLNHNDFEFISILNY